MKLCLDYVTLFVWVTIYLMALTIHELKRVQKIRLELAKNRKLEDIAADNGFELALFNLSEYQKGGSPLIWSCI